MNGGVNLLDVTVIILCTVGLFQTKLHFKKPPQFITLALFFILIALLSLLLTPLHLTAAEYLTSLFYTARFSLYILLGWLIFSRALKAIGQNISHVLLFSGVGLAILGLLQFIFLPDLRFLTTQGWDPHFFRTASTFLDPNFLGAYLVLTFLLLTHTRCVPDRHIRNMALIIVYIALLTTFSRGTYLAFLTSFLTLSFLQKSLKLAIITIVLFALLLLGFTTYQRLVAQVRGIDRTQSAEFRLNSWQQGWQLFSSHPILGVGFNTYRYALQKYNLGDEQFLKSHGSSTNDSSLLYVAATTGIIGLVSYIFFLGSIFVTGIKIYPPLVAGLLGLSAQSFFANTLFYPFLLIWIILMATKSHFSKDQKR